jgi:DNA polymerase-3 subunit beta
MKFVIDKIDMEKLLTLVSPFLDKRNDGFTSSFLLSAKDGKLTVKATNIKSGLSASSNDVAIEVEGEILVDGSRFLQVIKPLKKDLVTVEQSNDEIVVKQGRSRFKVKTMSADSFYRFPKSDGLNKISFNGELLRNGFEKTSPSIDANSPKYELTGGLISIKREGVNFVSTDTKRLTLFAVETDLMSDDLEMIIPKHAIVEIPKLFFDGDIELIYSEDLIIIESENKFFFSKLISGKYPNWQRIVPSEHKLELNFNRKEWLENLKLVSTVNSEIKVSLKSDGVGFETLEYQTLNSRAEAFIDTNIEIEDSIIFGVNAKFIIEFLSMVDGDEFTVGFNEPNRPFALWHNNLKTVIMPINL